jgi:hypothetical protein
MASVLKVDTLTGVTTAGSIAVTGEGNSTTTNLQQGLLKMWANLSGGGTPAIDDSLNTSSVTDTSAGRRVINLANSMNNTNYCALSSALKDGNSGGSRGAANTHMNTQSTGSTDYQVMYGSTASSDGNVTDSCTEEGLALAGDLA